MIITKQSRKNGAGFGAAVPLITALAPLAVTAGQHLMNKYFEKRKKTQEAKSAGKILKRIRASRRAGMCCGKFNR